MISLPIMINISFVILGGGIKYIDDAFDEEIFNKNVAVMLAPLLGLLWGYTMYIDKYASTILLAILLGVLFKGKIDNRAHLYGAIVIFLFIILFRINIGYLLLIILFISGLLDEIGNDMVDRRKNFSNLFYKFLEYFFRYRFMMKVAVVAIAIFGIIPYYIAIAFLLFDMSYHVIGYYGKIKSGNAVEEAIA